ncbi:ABC transporter permease [uncultured Alistipes sp.]|jgi:ABC-2 type transport system permease protein|uniref:ABC transporter permease n=1 Tax=uncultured Alistipes sp. TaxID=538949 RepID=UPI0028049482|nr:ABC transporter permease [uncultured Alistipes sp.]
MSNVSIIIQREFNERVRKKSFIITTILMPVLMIVLMIAPALIMEYSRGEQKTIAVIDDSGLVAPQLQSNEELRFEPTDLTTEEARRSLTDRFGVLYIGSDILENPSDVKLYANASSSLSIESNITGQIEDILEAEKLKAYHIDNLQQILDEVKTTVTLQTFRNDKSQEAESQAQSSTVATAAGYILGFVLYMFLLIYGSMVMQSVIEEKNNRVLEVVVSSVRPFDLMLGKILGVALVAVVQVLIWGVLIFAVGAIVLPQLMPAEMMAGVQAMQQGMPDAAAMGDMDPEMLQAVAAVTDTGYILKIFVCLLLFVFGGYLLYSAMFAAVGSAVDNVQDASQLQMPVTLPIILALLMMLAVIKDPNSSLAFWFSIIPFTSPVVMMARIPYDIPLWEIVLSLVILYASFVAMVWFAGKIYRVGIFMYGKKPTFKELLKWVRYKY